MGDAKKLTIRKYAFVLFREKKNITQIMNDVFKIL